MSNEGAHRPEFLTVRELADLLRIKERKVYDLAASGAVPCSRVTGKLLFPEPAIRAWIARGSSGGVQTPRPGVFLGSHDPLLEWALRQSRCGLATLFDGSFDGLSRFRAGEGVATGLHVRDPGTRAWNITAAEAECGGENAVLVAWATRRRGLVVRDADDAPTGLADLAGCRVVPRQPESGSQALFLDVLSHAGMTTAQLTFAEPARSEADAIEAVAQSRGDAAFGLEVLARLYGLRFIPVLEERFDLLADRRAWFEPPLQRLWDFCAGPEFRDHAKGVPGYDVSALGQIRWNA